ncbi:MAG: SRPBCC family protein [Mycobacterium sp.]
MGIALRPPTPSVDRRIAAPAERVWQILVELDQWPLWGPSVRRAELSDGGTVLSAGARGTVWTAVGVALPFVVTEFAPGRRWGWTVAGVRATGHEVTAVPGGCLVRFETPFWALGYLPVCAAALTRIDRLAG